MTRTLLIAAVLLTAVPVFAQTGGSPKGPDISIETFEERAVKVKLWTRWREAVKDHEYELRYVIRVHTRKGEAGPLLGTQELPAGTALVVGKSKAHDGGLELSGEVDITCRQLTAMTNVPRGKYWTPSQRVFFRIEPHLFDLTEKKYITPSMTPANVVVGWVNDYATVSQLMPLCDWVERDVATAPDEVAAALATLETYHAGPAADRLLKALQDSNFKKEHKLSLANAMPAGVKGPLKVGFHDLMHEWKRSEDADLKAAGQRHADAATR